MVNNTGKKMNELVKIIKRRIRRISMKLRAGFIPEVSNEEQKDIEQRYDEPSRNFNSKVEESI